ncbi:MAG: pilus assembly protein PilM, partial [FCB group bacterium]|nr:pilus assembly protein PilM [FCB group bacterium]
SELEVIEDDESEILSETADTVPEILEAAVEDESEPEHVENFVKPEILPGQLPVVSADSDENRNSTTLMSNGKTIRLSHIGNEKNQSSAHQEERADLNSLVEDSSPTHTGSSIKSTLPGPLKEILDAKKKNHVSSPGKPQALLEKLEVIKDSSREIKPDEFEANLLKTIPDAEFKTGIEKSFISLKNELNESSKKITIFQEEKVIRLLELKESSKATDIERYEVYSLPYDTGRMNIKTIEVLLDHILQNEIHPGKAAKAYCAFTSSTHLSKTQVFQTQRMKGKDLEGLIEWHARKNLPFPADHAVINYEIFRSKDKNHKDTVVLNVGGINQIESSQAQFEAANLILRQYSTIPVLMWKSFVKNYPDKDKGSFILVHIGESKTFVAVVKDHILLHSREIAISVQDLYKAVMQKIMVNGETVDIDLPMAMELLAKYGFPQVRTGVAEVFGIDLYKISIFLRPVVERITSEINRSLNYFKKQDPDLACEYMLYDGIGSSFPHLIHTINEPINLTPGYLNPIRSGNYTFQGGPVPENMLPEMGINLAMTHSEVEKQNVLPKKFRKEHKYIFLSKLAALLAIILLPIFVITGFWSHSEIRHLENQISGKTDIYSDLMLRKGDMNLYQRDVSILNDYYKFMKNDRIFSQYQISTMKLLSAIVPKDVKFTSMSFTKQALRSVVADTTSQTAQLRDILSIRGFVDSDISLSHIHLTNFRLKLEQLRYFTSVNLNIEDVSKISGDKLIFSLKLGI